MTFTDAEMAVLSDLSYYKKVLKKEQDLSTVLDILKDDLSIDLGPQYDEVIDGLIAKSKGCKIVDTEADKKTGFDAMAIAGPNNDVTVVCRGTQDATDALKGDLGLVMGTGETSQHKQMEKFLDRLNKKGYDSFSFCGHSLGGNLAMYGAIYLAETGKVEGVTTFNAPNFNSEFCKNHKKKIDIIKEKTKHYQNEYDIVSSINEENTFGEVVICKSLDDNETPVDFENGSLAVNDHGLNTLDINYGHIVPSDDNCKKASASAIGDVATRGEIILIDAAVAGVVSGLSVGGLAGVFVGGAIFIGTVIAAALTVAVISYVYNKVKEWFYKHSTGYKYSNSNPYIVINTDKMNSYASQLENLSRRAKNLDRRMNNLYWHAGFDWNVARAISNLGTLLKTEIVLDFALRLDKNVSYLRATANEFEKVEREVLSLMG